MDDIDIFIGGVSERPMEGSLLGHTFLCIVGDQFARLRVADAAVVLSFPLCLLLRLFWVFVFLCVISYLFLLSVYYREQNDIQKDFIFVTLS